MNLRPLGDRLVIKAIAKDEMTKSGLVLPDTASKERPQEGEVIAVGPGKMSENGTLIAMTVKIGDKVLFKKYAPDEFKFDGEEYLVLSEQDLLAVVE
ncbi:co-chaperone GroES [Patescibacteria group bacterium]|nr:co-chaperone GroES [Patescibacteria group bacterium]